MDVHVNIGGNQVRIALNEEDFRDLVSGKVITGCEDNDSSNTRNIKVAIILQDIGYGRMLAAIEKR